MDLWSYEQTETTVGDIPGEIKAAETRCTTTVRELIELDNRFRALLVEAADEEFEHSRKAMDLKYHYQKFQGKWTKLVENLHSLRLLVTLDQAIPDETDPATPFKELENPDDDLPWSEQINDSPWSEQTDDPLQRILKGLDRYDVEETIDRIDTDETELPFREQLARAIEDGRETPSIEESVEAINSIESDTDERRERMAELLSQEETPSVHLWDLLEELDN
jgi:hypothetical protein